MLLDPVLNIPGEYEMRQLHQLAVRDDRPCFNSNAVEVVDGLSRACVLAGDEFNERLLKVSYPSEPEAKFCEIVELTRRIAELLHTAGKAEESYVQKFTCMLECLAAKESALHSSGACVTVVFARKIISKSTK